MSKVQTKVYGYAVVDKDGNPAPLNRKVYDSKAAASNSWTHAMKRWTPFGFERFKDTKFKDQNEYKIVGLVAE